MNISRSQVKRLLRLYPSLREVRGSGRSWSSKLDLSGDKVKIECKATMAKSYRLSKDDLGMWERQARREGCVFGVIVSFLPEERDYLVVPLSDVEEFTSALRREK